MIRLLAHPRLRLACAIALGSSTFAIPAAVTADQDPAVELREVESALAATPTSVTLLVERSHLLIELHRFDDALRSLDRAEALAPDDGRPIRARAELHMTSGRLDAARAVLDARLRSSPDDRASWLLHADVAEAQDDLRAAADDVRAALELGYDDATALRAFRLLRAGGETDEAAQLIVAAASRRPAHPAILLEAIEERIRERAYGMAIDLVNELARGAQVPTRMELLRGRIYALDGRSSLARRAYARALELANDTLRRRISAAALADRGQARMGLGDFDDAIVDLEAARSLSPGLEGLAALLERARAGRTER